MPYKTIAEGIRRTYTITLGLREGYGKGTLHHSQTADEAVSQWIKSQIERKQLVLSGFFTETSVHYGYKDGKSIIPKQEPGLRFWGEVSVLRLADISDEAVIKALNSLADTLGEALYQEHVIVSYRDSTWVRELNA